MLTEIEFNKVVEYIQQKLIELPTVVVPVNYENDIWNNIEAIPVTTVQALERVTTYTGYKEQAKKSKKVKPAMSPEMKAAWDKWWNLWPATKSVPDTQYKSGAKMRGTEAKMMEKWLAVVNANGVVDHNLAIMQMYKAADCYLKWGYYDSIRKNRNELEGRSGMEPWLNQKQYLIYVDTEYPPVHKNTTEKVIDYIYNG